MTISTGAERPLAAASVSARADAESVLKTACSESAVTRIRVLPR
jgi:hypothetical protein